MTIVMVSHDFSVVAALCPELLVLRGGRTIETGPTLDVIASPQDEYTAAWSPRFPGCADTRDPSTSSRVGTPGGAKWGTGASARRRN